MQKLALGALIVGLFACGGNKSPTQVIDSGGGGDGGSDVTPTCDPALQTGCSGSNSRCTWITDTAAGVGHIGCVDVGTAAIGSACGVDGSGTGFPSWDNCDGGSLCNGTCEPICNLSAAAGSAGACATGYACEGYVDLFEVNGATDFGLCNAECNPLTDNYFGSDYSAMTQYPPKTTSTCSSGEGCYGLPNIIYQSDTTPVTFTCAPAGGEMYDHRTGCVPGTGSDPDCAPDTTGGGYLNGCAPGYAPIYVDDDGSTQWDCLAYCQPQDCYIDGSGTKVCPFDQGSGILGVAGLAPHNCGPQDVRSLSGYTFPTNTGSGSLNQCVYWWSWQFDRASGDYIDSAYDDIGFCYDETKYDLTGSDGSDLGPPPPCDTLPGSGSGIGPLGLTAPDLGCVSYETAVSLGYFTEGSGSAGFRSRHAKHRPFSNIRLPEAPSKLMFRRASMH